MAIEVSQFCAAEETPILRLNFPTDVLLPLPSARILAKITAEGVFVEQLEHNPVPWAEGVAGRLGFSVWQNSTAGSSRCFEAQYLPSGPVEGLSEEAPSLFGRLGGFVSKRGWKVPGKMC